MKSRIIKGESKNNGAEKTTKLIQRSVLSTIDSRRNSVEGASPFCKPHQSQACRFRHAVILLSAFFFLPACMSRRDGKTLKKDIFEINTRLLSLESSLKETGDSSAESMKKTNMRQANSTARVDKLDRQILIIQGDIDSLKVGVRTGKLPGASDTTASVAVSLEVISDRLVKIEETQAELILALEKKGRGKPTRRSSGKKKKNYGDARVPLRKIADYRRAFSQKEYSIIVGKIGRSIKLNKGNVQKELYYFQAESLFRLGKLSEAAIKFNDFIGKYKSGGLTTKSRIRMGDCYRLLGDSETALIYYNEALSAKLSKSDSKSLKEKIAKIKSK